VDSFWDFFWFTISFFLLFAYLMVLFQIVGDLFRDHTVGGGMKALWIICLIFFPFITMVVYLIARGHGMAERNLAAAQGMKAQQDEYIRSVASSGGGGSASDEIARAKSLLDSGAITQEEFNALKAKALS
jgi:Short C-terminal domain/Phospholipase_D-nuclease N-terminal